MAVRSFLTAGALPPLPSSAQPRCRLSRPSLVRMLYQASQVLRPQSAATRPMRHQPDGVGGSVIRLIKQPVREFGNRLLTVELPPSVDTRSLGN
jgi:hypothetical protein